MSTPTPRRAPTHLDFFRHVLRSIDKLPAKSRPGLIGVILFMLLSMVALNVLGGQASVVVGLLGIAGAIVVIATAGRYAPLLVVILLAFCISIIYLNRQPASEFAPTVVEARDPSRVAVKQAGIVGKETVDDSALVSGNIRFRDTHAAVQGAFVDVEGYGDVWDTTDVKGFFAIKVPRRVIKLHRDSVTLAIQTSRTDLFNAPFDGRPFGITLEPLPASVAGAPPRAEAYVLFAAFHGGSPEGWTPPATVGGQEGFHARLVLDSVKTVQDGSVSDTYWRFDVNVNDVHAITIPERAYDQSSGRNLLHLAGEVTVDLPRASPFLIHIRGLRDAFIGVHQINGFQFVDGASLPTEQPVHRQLLVEHETDRGKGEFIFYYTLVRRGTPNIRPSSGAGVAAALG
ncbi:MAG TPA: hypothetical protein VGO40_01345 [Longimicrobium sp.]|jgi:hypothetical protein|nr:hypothetical protein [Longimicrobium sp.]